MSRHQSLLADSETKTKADAGDANAQYNLGRMYFDGDGVTKNPNEAVTWLRKSAEQGNIKAEYALGAIYYNGESLEKDLVQAAGWLRRAAEQGDVKSQSLLGRMYIIGEGVKQDIVEALNWYKKAAERGDADSQFVLGQMYDNGIEGHLETNHIVAASWYRKSAEQGKAEAQYYIGCDYINGVGVPQDDGESLKWFRKAADQGLASAQYNLGVIYGTGKGVTLDYVEAYKWYNLSAAQGFDNAAQNRDGIAGLMTPAQIAEAQRLAREFVPRKETSGSNSSTSPSLAVGSPIATATGFFITDDGCLISNYHVVKDAAKVRLLTCAGTVDARVVRVDAANDLALLKADGKFSSLPIASSRSASLGATVATVGFPNIGLQGFSPKLAKGEIAALAGAADDARYFQISVPLQPGNSGGALVDEHGNVVGIVSAKLNAEAALASSGALPENVNYAVKSSFLLSFLESVPEVSAKLKSPNTADQKFEDVVKSAQAAAVLVLVY